MMEKSDITTFAELLRYVGSHYSNPTALNFREKNSWHSVSTEVFIRNVRHLTLGLISLGLKKGDRVGILAHPSSNWTIADFAIIMAGGVAVPLFVNLSEENFLHEITETEMKIIFVEGTEPWQIYQKHSHLFQKAISLHDKPDEIDAILFDEALAEGEALEKKEPHLFQELEQNQHPDDLAAIIYTSGSTGKPKGVELTHINLICNTPFSEFEWDSAKDRYLSVLPLAHVFGFSINLWAIVWGASIYYSNDYKNLGVICQEVKPTALVVVPRLLEKIHSKIFETIHHSPKLKRKIGEWALRLASNESPSLTNKWLRLLADKIVYSKLRHFLGGHIRFVISGGAHLNPHLHRFFINIGIPIYEGWGLTEACPVCVNSPKKNIIGTVGPAIMDQQIKIGPNEEVLVKGPLVMKGYYCNPEATAQTIDAKGWLHTGDRGEIDKEGYLTIKGRIKELYKTSTGEYVAPIPIEQALCQCAFIDMSMVVAEGRKFASCLLFPKLDVIARMKSQQQLTHLSDEEFLKHPIIKEEMKNLLNDINKHLNHWEQIHEYRFILEPLSVEKGDLTPTMKIRRDKVATRFEGIINTMYPQEI